MQLLGGQQREAVGEVEAHLCAERRQRADAGAVLLLDPLVEDALHEVEILAHDLTLKRLRGELQEAWKSTGCAKVVLPTGRGRFSAQIFRT